MIVTGKNIKHISSTTHEGKVMLFGLDEAGSIFYTIRQSGFEDSALASTDNATGFEAWKPLVLDGSRYDASVDEREQAEICDQSGNRLLRSSYGRNKGGVVDESVVKSTLAPVELVSGLGHLYVFRMTTAGKLLCNRFVLDGIKNELVPKLEVRFRRSRQKLRPDLGAATSRAPGRQPAAVDSLDFRDIEGVPFQEPAVELSFIANLAASKPWFAVTLLPTMEHDQSRWNLFVYDNSLQSIVLYSVRASADGLFDLADTRMLQPDPARPDTKVLRHLSGISKRRIGLAGLTVANGFAAEVYHTQSESLTKDGTAQLLKGPTRIMLTVPVMAAGQTEAETAAISFAVAGDGTLSQIDQVPTTEILRSRNREVLLPLDTLDEIKGVADQEPPPAGTIRKMAKGSDDRVRIYSAEAIANLRAGERVRVRGTRSYDGHYQVSGVTAEGFEIQARFEKDEPGFWEMIEARDTGLVFDNMVTAYEKTANGKLKVLCQSHDLQEGDQIQVTGTRDYDGIYPVTSLGQDNSFLIDIDWQPGEAVNLRKVKRRGIRFDGSGDFIRTPTLDLTPARPDAAVGRTLSAWVWVDANRTRTELITGQEDGGMELLFDSDGKVMFRVRFADGSVHQIKDAEQPLADTWHHYAGVVDYSAADGKTRLSLCRNGALVTPTAEAGETLAAGQKIIAPLAPPHLEARVASFTGTQYIEVPYSADWNGDSFTISLWARPTSASGHRSPITSRDHLKGYMMYVTPENTWQFSLGTGSTWASIIGPSVRLDTWTHVAVVFSGGTARLYIDGRLEGTAQGIGYVRNTTRPLRIAAGSTEGGPDHFFRGELAHVQLWNRALSESEIGETRFRRLTGREDNLVGYWPLERGELRDLSRYGRTGTIHGTPQQSELVWRHPLPAPGDAGRTFDGSDDGVIIRDLHQFPTRKLTVAFWTRTTTTKSSPDILSYATSGAPRAFYVEATSPYVGFSETGTLPADALSFRDGAWHHVAVTWECDTGTLVLYQDGAERFRRTDYRKNLPLAAGGTLVLAQRQSSLGGGFQDSFAFDGSLCQLGIWSEILSAEEIKALVKRRLTGDEPDLVGTWVFDDGHVRDLSPHQSHGQYLGAPVRTAGPADLTPQRCPDRVYIGGDSRGRYFTGKISDVQIWNRTRTEAEIKDTMHLRLRGSELDLAGNWRLGGILQHDGQRTTPDFCAAARDARVYGDAYVSARELERAISAGKVVRYRNDQLYAVTRGATYLESFEFRAVRPEGTAFTLAELQDADGTGQPIFGFSYWGKRSQGSKEVIAFPAYAVQSDDFVALPDGWFRAACRFTVPDGVSMVRAFELGAVKGRWQSQTTAPADEWDRIEVRKHRVQLVSDSITRELFEDTIALAPVGDPQRTITLGELELAEKTLARRKAEVVRLIEQVEVAGNNAKYTSERNTLNARLTQSRTERGQAQTTLDALRNNPVNYVCRIAGQASGRYLTVGSTIGLIWNWLNWPAGIGLIWDWFDHDLLKWSFTARQNDYYSIRDQQGHYIEAMHAGNGALTFGNPSYHGGDSQLWKIEHRYGGSYIITNKASNRVLDVTGGSTSLGASVILWDRHGGSNQLWKLDKLRLLDAAQNEIGSLERKISGLDQDIARMESRVRDLDAWLSGTESLSTLQGRLTTARQALTSAQNDFNTKNTALLDSIARNQQSVRDMPELGRDARDLVTRGARLGFARPAGSLGLHASCEGNLLLSYFDQAGRMRLTRYDATADSRNTQFEQWIPDALRAGLEFRDATDRITLDGAGQPITLAANQWTIETWFHHPGAVKSDGSRYEYNALFSAKEHDDYPIAIKDGRRLGTVVDGFFHDSGVNLDSDLAHGWHHLAAVGLNSATRFYIDGRPVGRPTSSGKHAIQFDGLSDHVLCSNARNVPTGALSIGFWIRSRTSKADAAVISYATSASSSALLISRPQDLRVTILDTSCDATGINVNDGRWHHISVTWTNSTGTLLIYKDGVQAFSQLGFKQNSTLAGGGALVLAQKQGSVGGGFDVARAFDGALSGLSLWSQARIESEIKEDMYRVLKGDETGLVSYWSMEPFTDGGVQKLRDLVSGSTNHLTLGGKPVIDHLLGQCTRDVTYIGNARDNNAPAGQMAEVRLWSVPLGDSEIAAQSKALVTGCEPGLVAWYPLNEATGAQVRNQAVDGQRHGTGSGCDWIVCTAPIGYPDFGAMRFDGVDDYITFPTPFDNKAGGAITIEAWVYLDADVAASGPHRGIVTETFPGSDTQIRFSLWLKGASHQLQAGFFAAGNWYQVIDGAAFPLGTWVHVAASYDGHVIRLFRNGTEVASSADLARALPAGADEWRIGRRHDSGVAGDLWQGQITEVRIWNRARTAAEIAANRFRRVDGSEPELAACFPLDGSRDGKVSDIGPRRCEGALRGPMAVRPSGLPIAAADRLVVSEYDTIGPDPQQPTRRLAMMRRCLGYTAAGQLHLVADQRIEELELKWIGNAQFEPTLLGYIETPPPVPSENLTVNYDYDGAASVQLTQSDDVEYSWTRSQDTSQGLDLSMFLGVGWGVTGGLGIETKISEGKAGFRGTLNLRKGISKSSTVSARSSEALTDRLELRGGAEVEPQFEHLGSRYVPKNVGYALVVSGLADVFISRLKRSGRMVSYQMLPVEGVPLDVNTITFLVNPAYVRNGSLDGLVGSQAADERFFRHVPEMRAQYGSLYPSSFMRLEEAYDLKGQIERQDAEREAYFINFDATNASEDALTAQTADSADYERYGQTDMGAGQDGEKGASAEQRKAQADQAEKDKQREKEAAQQRQDEINKKHKSLDKRVEASAGFDAWQRRMENLQIRAAKRNIVNTYVWDADGGMRSEEQSFVNTVEHSVGGSFSISGALGLELDIMVAAFKGELSALYAGEMVQTMSKSRSGSRGFELHVSLDGIESKGITGADDRPLQPGEKVDRYRFMSFFLEGSSQHFHDFFDYVVDPEWLMSNDEEARALRQTQAGRPNKAWRVLHRVTYVERPALMGFGGDLRKPDTVEEAATEVLNYFDALEQDNGAIKSELGQMKAQLGQLATKLDQLLARSSGSST